MRAARVDANQDAIVGALEAAGASVWIIGMPVDLLVGFQRRTYIIEVKNPQSRYGKKGANKNQLSFIEGWRGYPVVIAHTADDALRAIGAIR